MFEALGLATDGGGNVPADSAMIARIRPADISATGLDRFAEETQDVTRPERLFELLCAFAQNFDCPWIAYGSLTHLDRLREPGRAFPSVWLNYPPEWRAHYFANGYDRIDPIVTKSRRRVAAFAWSDIYRKNNAAQNERRIFDEAAGFGLRSGVSIPLHGPDGGFAIMSFARPRDEEFKSAVTVYLQAAALHFHAILSKLSHASGVARQFPVLSVRERECLLWAAKGKSSWDTGMILGISENTVNFHIKNAMRKLDSRSRTVAAVKALRLGLIES